MASYHEQLQVQALSDLSNRSKSGIPMYMLIWLAISITLDVHVSHPLFFQVNTVILAALICLRAFHMALMRDIRNRNVTTMTQWFTSNLLLCSLHWGGMVGFVVYDPSLSDLETIMMIITPAFALGGACTLSISSEIRVLYPTLMFTPIITIFILNGDTESILLAVLSSLMLLYIFSSSKASHKDYWEAITNYLVAEERAEQMEKLSVTDPLTQIHNRMYFDSEYSQEWKRSLRLKSVLSVIMIDIDYFKRINDTYGHVFGDECLKIIAKAIRDEVKRPTDCVARYGGEEFVVLLPTTNEAGAKTIANRIRRAVEKIQVDYKGTPVSMTISIGGATSIPSVNEEKNLLIRRADSALYLAKENGRNQYQAETTGTS
ncbi:MAG: hypothetical protein C9356_14070 [Oleiphilus sp.]|nr:MAG: hypothetical protein C9356_14070 [Oleiphilus sp.]